MSLRSRVFTVEKVVSLPPRFVKAGPIDQGYSCYLTLEVGLANQRNAPSQRDVDETVPPTWLNFGRNVTGN